MSKERGSAEAGMVRRGSVQLCGGESSLSFACFCSHISGSLCTYIVLAATTILQYMLMLSRCFLLLYVCTCDLGCVDAVYCVVERDESAVQHCVSAWLCMYVCVCVCFDYGCWCM